MRMEDKNILYGGPIQLDVQKDYRSLGEFVFKSLQGHGDLVSIVSVNIIEYSP